MMNTKMLMALLLVVTLFAGIEHACASPVFTCTFSNGNPATVTYSVAGGEPSVTYDVRVEKIVGCASIVGGTAAVSDLVGVTQTQNFQLTCQTQNSSGYLVLQFWKNESLLSTWYVEYASNSNCTQLTQTVVKEIPTLSEWAMILFSVVLLGLMTWYVIRRRRAVHAAV